jgi:hypothetical protein
MSGTAAGDVTERRPATATKELPGDGEGGRRRGASEETARGTAAGLQRGGPTETAAGGACGSSGRRRLRVLRTAALGDRMGWVGLAYAAEGVYLP